MLELSAVLVVAVHLYYIKYVDKAKHMQSLRIVYRMGLICAKRILFMYPIFQIWEDICNLACSRAIALKLRGFHFTTLGNVVITFM